MATPATPVAATPAVPAAPPAPPAPAPASAPAATPAPEAQPAAPAVAATSPKPEPKAASYPQTEDGIAQFVREHDEWAAQQPEGVPAQPAEPKPAEAQPAAEAKPGEEAQPGEKPGEEKKPAEAAGPLPQALEAAINGDEALKAALEANPAARDLVMDIGRRFEAARPVLELVPTVDDARFVTEHANVMLDLRHNALLGIENPEARTGFWDGLRSQFVETDDKGAPVVGTDGKAVLGKDYDLCLLTPAANEKLGGIMGRLNAGIAELEQKLKGYYPSEADKAADQKRLDDLSDDREAIGWVLELVKMEGGAGDQALPPLPDDATPAQKEAQARLERTQAELRRQQEAAGKGKQTETVRAFENELRVDWQRGVGRAIDVYLKAMKDRGETISDYHLQQKWLNPQTQKLEDVSALAVTILNEFNATVMGISREREQIQKLERQGPAARPLRESNAARLRTTYLEPIIRKHVQAIQEGIRESARAEAARHEAISHVARREPQGAAVPAAQPNLTEAQLQEQALKLAEQDPRWNAADADERKILLMTARTAVKFGG